MAYGDDPIVNAPAPAPATMPMLTVRPQAAPVKLTPDDFTKRWSALGYAPGGTAGVMQSIFRESGGDPNATGDGGTSRGLFQHHAERKAELEKFAAASGGSADDPDIQIKFADHEMQTQYPKLRAKLMDPNTTAADAEEAFRKIFERPKATGGYGADPVTSTDNFRFSDYALKQFKGKPNTDVVWMKPSDYLDLTPDLGDDPRAGKSYAALKKSLAAGDELQEIPSLEISAGEGGAKVTDQDGRQRARAAADAGVDRIPVAVKRAGKNKGPITELEGMNGRLLPYDFQAVDAKAAPSASSAQANPFDQFDQAAQAAGQSPASGKPRGLLERFGTGLMDAAYGVGRVADLVPPPEQIAPVFKRLAQPRTDLTQQAQQREAGIQAQRQATGETGTDLWRLAGNAAGLVPLAALGGAGAGGGLLPRLAAAGVGGGIGGMAQPPREGGTAERLRDTAVGTVLGVGAGAAGEALVKAASPIVDPIVRFFKGVKGPEVMNTPAGREIVRRMEQDTKGGGPTAQDILDELNLNHDKPLTLMDLGGENVKNLAGSIARAPGPARQTITSALESRDLDAGLRLQGDIGKGLGDTPAYDAVKALGQARSTAAAPKYDAAFKNIIPTADEAAQVKRFVADPIGQTALQKGPAGGGVGAPRGGHKIRAGAIRRGARPAEPGEILPARRYRRGRRLPQPAPDGRGEARL